MIVVVAVAGLWMAGYLIRDGQNKADRNAVEQVLRSMSEEPRRMAEARERAWAAHDKPPRECEHPGDDWKAQVECANHYMRARKAFDATCVPAR